MYMHTTSHGFNKHVLHILSPTLLAWDIVYNLLHISNLQVFHNRTEISDFMSGY